ncbi:AraC family transcriptional regulator [Uliginosibacterium aquaticum]|uniref:AraC family transcriptional regulator n=1 Tax=Uliginosibacterium aquaticum TaxID=2731212 RepID=A0ABX2ILM2_9RHOO|nr:AraC family transcriptional regulator [Uliginosibacterium aquaticum]NSL55208.1 AraC family transcriptional regulator [Uliginosibacterium aquaticum]
MRTITSPLPPMPGPGELRVGVFTHLCAELRRQGIAPEPIFEAAGFDRTLLDDPNGIISYRCAAALTDACVRLGKCSCLGLRLGMTIDDAVLGTLGTLVRHSPNVGTALNNLIEYLSLHNRAAIASLKVNGANAHIGYAILEGGLPGGDQFCASAMGRAFVIMRSLCGAAWRPIEVRFPFRVPAEAESYREAFQAPVCFDAEHTELIFPACWLQLSFRETDIHAYACAAWQAGMLEARGGRTVAAVVRREIWVALMGGKCAEEQVADALDLHKRSLNRLLQKEGTTFRHLLDEIRFCVAQQMLRDSNRSIEDIAKSLGYSESTAFGRSFKRIGSYSPQAWRNSVRTNS